MGWENKLAAVDYVDRTPAMRVGQDLLGSLLPVGVYQRELVQARTDRDADQAARQAVVSWQLFLAMRERERERRRALEKEGREILERDFRAHVVSGRVALTAVLGLAAAVGAMADVRAWSTTAKLAYASGAVALGVGCGWAEGVEVSKKELRRIAAEIAESEYVERRGEVEAGGGDSAVGEIAPHLMGRAGRIAVAGVNSRGCRRIAAGFGRR